MARKGMKIKGFRESAARRKAFATRYYTADIHTASRAMPQFMLETLENKGDD